MGIIVVEENRIVDMIEKPEVPISQPGHHRDVLLQGPRWPLLGDRPGAGDAARLQGEYFLADAIKLMIEDGKLLRPYIATAWEDTGTPEFTLHAHRFVLDRSGGQARPA